MVTSNYFLFQCDIIPIPFKIPHYFMLLIYKIYDKVLKNKIINCIIKGKLNNSEIASIFEIDKKTIYNWRKTYKANIFNSKRKSKITTPIKNILFNMLLIKLILTIKN